jgi:hypothetical protein
MIYKYKDKKINPVNISLSNDIKPEDESLSSILKVYIEKIISYDSRLISEYLIEMKIDIGILWESEWEWYINIFFEFKGILTFKDNHINILDPIIESPIKIYMIPYKSW